MDNINLITDIDDKFAAVLGSRQIYTWPHSYVFKFIISDIGVNSFDQMFNWCIDNIGVLHADWDTRCASLRYEFLFKTAEAKIQFVLRWADYVR